MYDPQDDEELVKIAHQAYKSSTNALNTSNGVDFEGWISEAKLWYRLVAGDQWKMEDWSILRRDNRSAITMNRTGVMLDVVAGLEIQNRMVPTAFPREMNADDARKSEYLNGILDWQRDDADYDEVESEAFGDLLTCGMGWTDTTLDYEEEEDGELKKLALDPLRCRWDPGCMRKNLKGSDWRMYIMDMKKSAFNRKWPDKSANSSGPWEGDIDSLYDESPHLADEAWKYQNNSRGDDNSPEEGAKKIRIAKFQYCKYVKKYRVQIPGDLISISEKEFNSRKDSIEAVGFRYMSQTVKEIHEALICGNVVLEDKVTPTGRFTLEAMTGKHDRANKCFYGIVRAMKDPQLWANKFLSSILDIVSSNAKGGVMAESGAFQNDTIAKKEWARADKLTMLEPGGINKISAKPVPPLPQGIQYMLEYTGTMFPHTSGISLELMGLVQHNQPGILEHQRKQSGISILAWAFSALRYYRKENARTTLDFVREYLSDGRLFRIEGEAGQELSRIVRDEMVYRYDIIVDESPTSINQTERTWAILSEVLPLALKAQIPIPPTVLRYMPLPEKLKTEWLGYIKEMQQRAQQDPQQQQLAQVEARKTESETEENLADAELKRAKTQEIAQTIPIKAAKDLAEARHKAALAGRESGLVLGGGQ